MDSILKRRFRAKKTQEHLIIGIQPANYEVLTSIGKGLKKYREENDFPNMDIVRLEIGSRCLTRPMLRMYINQHQVSNFIFVIEVDQPYEYFLSYMRAEVEFELKEEKAHGGKVVFLFSHNDMGNNEINYTPSQEYSELIDDFSKIHRTVCFNICSKTGEGIDKAFDWLADQIAQDVAKKAELTPVPPKKKNGLHWLAEAGKKVLSFGFAHN